MDVLVDKVRLTAQGPLKHQKMSLAEITLMMSLYERRGNLVTRDELTQLGWGGRPVTHNSLTVGVANIRRFFTLNEVDGHDVILTMKNDDKLSCYVFNPQYDILMREVDNEFGNHVKISPAEKNQERRVSLEMFTHNKSKSAFLLVSLLSLLCGVIFGSYWSTYNNSVLTNSQYPLLYTGKVLQKNKTALFGHEIANDDNLLSSLGLVDVVVSVAQDEWIDIIIQEGHDGWHNVTCINTDSMESFWVKSVDQLAKLVRGLEC